MCKTNVESNLKLTVNPLLYIGTTLDIRDRPGAVLLALVERTLHAFAVRESDLTWTVLLIILVAALQSVTIHLEHRPLPMALAILPAAFVTASV